MKHFSLDIETLGTDSTSAILSIGMYLVIGQEDAPDPKRLFKANISLYSCLAAGLTVDGDTFRWWMGQSQTSRDALFIPEPIPLTTALIRLRYWYRRKLGSDEGRVWSHATFDAPIIHHAMKVCEVEIPWRYTHCRDLRTLLDGIQTTDLKRGSVLEHDAGWDAFAQGQQVLEAIGII